MARVKLKKFDELTLDDIKLIHRLMQQGMRIASIMNLLKISRTAINLSFERNKYGKPSNQLNNKNNGNKK